MKKIAVIPVSRRKTHELVIERRRIDYKDKASGYSRGIEDQARRTSMQVTALNRFRDANSNKGISKHTASATNHGILTYSSYLKVDLRCYKEFRID